MNKVVTTIVISAFLSGCATVRSNWVDSKPIALNQKEGLSYFLPARYMKLTVTRELLDPASLKAALDKKTAEFTALEISEKAAIKAAKDKADELASLAATVSAETRAAVTTEVQRAEAQVVIASRDAKAAKDVVTGLKALLQAAQAGPTNACTYTAKLELLAPHPDPSARFVAQPVHNPFRDDTSKLVVTDGGLLSSSNVVADDKTGQIIVELAGAIGAFSGGMPSVALGDPSEVAQPVRCDSLPKKFIRIFDPADPNQTTSAELQNAQFPLSLKIARIDGTALTTPNLGDAGKSSPNPQPVIYYRSAVPLRVTVSECANGQVGCDASASSIMDETLVMIPQAGPVSYIPMQSSAFVKTVNDVQFENGMIKSWTAERPSEVLEIVRLPVKVLTSLISVPASMLQLRVNYNVNSKSLAEAQLAEIKSDNKLRAFRACLVAAGDDPAKAKACLSE
jgi:hypothetical protein